jgi:hypothetical protein
LEEVSPGLNLRPDSFVDSIEDDGHAGHRRRVKDVGIALLAGQDHGAAV